MFPLPFEQAINTEIENKVSNMQSVISLGRVIRDRRNMPLKHPLKCMTVITDKQQFLDDLKDLKTYILSVRGLLSSLFSITGTEYF